MRDTEKCHDEMQEKAGNKKDTDLFKSPPEKCRFVVYRIIQIDCLGETPPRYAQRIERECDIQGAPMIFEGDKNREYEGSYPRKDKRYNEMSFKIIHISEMNKFPAKRDIRRNPFVLTRLITAKT